MELTVRGMLCFEPHEVSLLFFLWYLSGGGGISRMTSISDGAQVRIKSVMQNHHHNA